MKRTILSIAVALLAGSFGAQAAPTASEPIQPIPPAKVTNPALVELGKQLYFDPRL